MGRFWLAFELVEEYLEGSKFRFGSMEYREDNIAHVGTAEGLVQLPLLESEPEYVEAAVTAAENQDTERRG